MKDCEELVRRMDKVFSKNELVKPADVVKDRSFRMTDPISNFKKSKSANRIFDSEAAEKKRARETIAAFEHLRLREKELEREEYLAKGRQAVAKTITKADTSWKSTYEFLNEHKAIDLLAQQQEANEKEALIKVQTDASLRTIKSIGRNLNRVQNIMGKSKSVKRLKKVKMVKEQPPNKAVGFKESSLSDILKD